ncbi:MAG TPA: hypothetical protein VIS76_17385 [Pseudomonadales bacterium]
MLRLSDRNANFSHPDARPGQIFHTELAQAKSAAAIAASGRN